MIDICWKILPLYRQYWGWLGITSCIITLVKAGDLVVPLLGGKVFEAVGDQASVAQTMTWLAIAVSVWTFHGNFLPWLYNQVDTKQIELFARRDISLWSLNRLTSVVGQDTAMLQTIVERGEAVITDFTATIIKTVLPVMLPCGGVMIVLIATSPMLFLVLVTGCGLYATVTLYMNQSLMPQYVRLQNADNRREQLRIKIFSVLAKPVEPFGDMIEAYNGRYTEVAKLGSGIRASYLNFDLSRGLIINLMNACTWIIGIHAVRSHQFGLAVFVAFLSWSSACISYVQVATALHKQWLETGPAMRNYFSIDRSPRHSLSDTQRSSLAMLQPAE